MKTKKLGIITLHSTIDLITNSSTEMFCTVEGRSLKIVEKILQKILEDMGCSAVEFYVRQHETEHGVVPNQFDIDYDYEIHHPPCKHILIMLKDKLNVVEIYNDEE